MSTWAGWCYTAFVVDVFSQRILGWAIATTMDTRLVQDALAMAMWQRDQQGRPIIGGLVHHSDKGTQNTSIAFGESLELAGISPSTGSVGDSYDNALMETINGLYKNECIKPAGPIRKLGAGRVRHRGLGQLVQPRPAPQQPELPAPDRVRAVSTAGEN